MQFWGLHHIPIPIIQSCKLLKLSDQDHYSQEIKILPSTDIFKLGDP